MIGWLRPYFQRFPDVAGTKMAFFRTMRFNSPINGPGNGDLPVTKVRPTPLKEGANPSLNKLIVAAMFILAALALASVASISHQSGMQLQKATSQFAHTREVLEKVEQISAGLHEVESSARSFAISGKQ